MKLTLKVVVALAVLMTAATVYAEVPDVSKWSCAPNAIVKVFPDYGVEVTACELDGSRSSYKVSGELIYIHEHRKDANGENVYYNALKTNKGNWVEVVNKDDLIWEEKQTENLDVEAGIVDDNGIVVAKRTIPLLKK